MRELYGMLPKLSSFAMTRWASLKKTARDVVAAFPAIVEAANAELLEPRACQAAVRDLLEDRLLLPKIVFLREYSSKMLVHIEFFESDKVFLPSFSPFL